MNRLLNVLLIPERRVGLAAVFRVFTALAIVVYIVTASIRFGPNGGKLPMSEVFLLLAHSLVALRWKRERGLWMLYVFLAVLTLGLCVAHSLTAPVTARMQTAREIADATIEVWICFLVARLMASAAVLNYRQFRDPEGKPPVDAGGNHSH